MAVVSDTMVLILRERIGDTDSSNYTYTSNRLKNLLAVSSYLLCQEVEFATVYTINIAATGITPDPFVAPDKNFIALTTLKAACMLETSEFKDKAKCASKVSDGLSSIDTTKQADGYKSYMDTDYNNCALFEQIKDEYVMGNYNAGEAILGPFSQSLGNLI